MARPKKGHWGAPMSGAVYSPKKKTSMAKKRKAQDERWARRSGEVVSYKVGEEKPNIPLPNR